MQEPALRRSALPLRQGPSLDLRSPGLLNILPRILSFDNHRVTFAYRDYKDGNAQKSMELPATEFLHRFLMHVVPPRFTRIRYYGFFSNRDRSANIAKARELIGSTRKLRHRDPVPDPRLCPQCHDGMMRLRSRVDPQRPRTWFDSS